MIAYIFYGVSASGKSTEAIDYSRSEIGARRLERDKIRESVIPNFLQEGWTTYSPTPLWENIVTHKWHSHLNFFKGSPLIISDTLLKIQARRELDFLLKHLGYKPIWKRMDTPLEECILRDSFRGNRSVGEAVIRKQQETLDKHKEHV